MTAVELMQYVKDGGSYCSPLLLLALFWMNKDRNRLLALLEAKSTKLENLSERTITVLTKFEGLLTGRKEAA